MTTATQAAGAAAPAGEAAIALPDQFSGEALTAAEEAYFDSGGALHADAADGGADSARDGAAAGGKPAGEGAAAESARPKTVPHAALHEEREGHKATRAELARERDARIALETRLGLIAEAFQARRAAGAGEPERPPDPEKDPAGAFRWAIDRIGRLEGRVGEAAQHTAAQAQHAALKDAYRADAQTFWSRQADFADAYAFLQQSRDRELEFIGEKDPAERARQIYREEMALAASYLQAGQSPAQALYELARLRGYQGKPRGGPAQDIGRIEHGQRAAKSLSGAGGSPSDTLTPEALLAMSEADFAKALDRLTPDQERRLFGG